MVCKPSALKGLNPLRILNLNMWYLVITVLNPMVLLMSTNVMWKYYFKLVLPLNELELDFFSLIPGQYQVRITVKTVFASSDL